MLFAGAHTEQIDAPAPANHVLAGHTIYSLRVVFEGEEKKAVQFQRCTGEAIHRAGDSGSFRYETVVGALLAESTETVDHPFDTTLEAAVGHSFQFQLSKSTGRNGGQPRNWINAIQKV